MKAVAVCFQRPRLARSAAAAAALHVFRPHPTLPLAFHAHRRGLHTPRAVMEKITFGTDLPGYEAGPKAGPAVIVLQEWWGVNDIIKEHATLLKDATGFRVLIPDLYKGKIGVDKEEAHHLMTNLDFPAAVQELGEAVSYLKSSGATKVGVVGFCMGGALTFATAQHAGVNAAAPFYGIPDPAICDPAAIKVPVQAHFGQLDTMKGFSDPESIKAVVEKMQAAGAPVELFLYEHCGHAFMNALTAGGREKIKEVGQADPPSDEPKLAFDRLVAFFKQHLA